MAIQVDVTVRSAATTASVTTESTKATADIAITGPQGPPGTGLTDSTTHWSSDRDFMPYASGEQSLGSGNYPWGEAFVNTGFFNDLTVSGVLNVSGDFNLGDSSTDKITTQGDLYVKDDAFFADEVVITGVTKAANVLPRTHDTYNLGSATARWANIHAKSGHFSANTITLGLDGAKISVVSNKIQLQGNSASEGPYFIGDTYIDAGTLSAQRAFGVQFQILNTNSTNSYKFSLDDYGNLGISGYVGSDKTGVVNFSNNVSIATSGYLRVPVGTTAERPPEVFDGMVRLNTTNSQFEGYHSSNWQGLGGVIDVDRDTYVSTEKTPNDDTLYLYTSGTERARIESNGDIKLYNNTYINNDLTVSGNLAVSGNFTLGDTTADSITSHGDLKVLDDSFFADTVTVTGLAYFESGVDIKKDLTVSGTVTASDPTQNGHLSTKSYVDSADSNLQTQITSNDTDVTALQVATGSLQTQVTSNDTDVSTLNTATGVLLSQITSNDTDISNINTNVNALLGDAVRTTGSQTITGIKTFNDPAVFLSDVRISGDIDLGDSAFDKITSKGDLYVEDAAFIDTSLVVSGTADFRGTVEGITPTQDSHFTTKAYVDTVDSSFQSQITLNDGDIGYLQVATGDLLTKITGNDADITALQTATGSLQVQVVGNDSDITALQAATGNLLTQITGDLQPQISSNDTDISNLNTATGSLQTQVTSNDTDISDLSGIAVMRSGEQTISGVKTFTEDINILGSLSVSGDFTLGDETTDKIITRGDLIVEDTVSVTGDASFAGLVGIGTDSPTSDLHISDAATPQMKIQDTTNDVIATVYADDTKAFIGSDTNHPVHIGVSGNSHLTIDVNGNVGVGKFESTKVGLGSATTDSLYTLNLKPANNSDEIALFKTYSNTNAVYVSSNGMMGIGTTSPDKTLHVAGGVAVDSDFQFKSIVRDTKGNVIISQSDANASANRVLTLGNSNYNQILFTTLLRAEGGIEILTTPTADLHVATKGYIDDNFVNLSGAQTVSGNKTFANDITVLGDLAVSGDFTLGDSTTDSITTRGDLYVEDDAVFSDAINVSGVAYFAGSVGVGTTTPEQAFHVKSVANQIRIEDSTNDKKFDLNVDGSKFMIDDMSVGANRFAIANDGKIGIGTTSPLVKFHLEGGSFYANKGLLANGEVEVSRFFASRNGSNGGTLSIQTRRDTTAANRWSAIQSLDSGGTARSLGLNIAGGNVGIGTAFPSVSLDISSTNAIKVPVGTDAQRPTPADGMVRLNTDSNQFEGYNNSNWQGLGGVIDVDQDTYVSTEKTSDDDALFFYTAGGERAKIDNAGNTFIAGDLTISGSLAVSGDFTLGDTTTDKITTRGDLYVEDDAFFADAVEITGSLTVDGTASAATPTQNGHLTTKLYVDSADNTLTTNLATSGTTLQNQITSNDSDITALNAATGSLQTQVTSNDGDISALQTATGSLQTQVSSNDTDIATINTNITSLSGDAVLLAGNQTIAGNKTFSDDVTILGDLAVSGDFTLGDATTDKITTRGDLYVEDDAVFSDTIRVTGDAYFAGDVGIGTASPSVALDISSTNAVKIPVGTTAQRPSAADGLMRLNTTTNQFEGYQNSNWQGLGGVIDVDQDTYVSTEKTSDDDTLFFYTAGSEKARLTSAGLFGIGTASPSYALEVNAGTGNTILNLISTDANATIRLADNTTSNNTVFTRTGDDLVICGDGGNVGIGTASPAAMLDIVADGGSTYAKLGYDTYASFQFYRNLAAGSTSTPVMMVRQTHPDDDQTALVVDQDGSGHILELIEDTTTRFVVQADGNVGIGTTTPDYTLDVAGSMGIDEHIYHNGDTDTYIQFDDDRVRIFAGADLAFDYDESGTSTLGISTNGQADITFGGGNVFFGGSQRSYDGRVGIGTATPSVQLQTTGDVIVGGNLTVSGTTFTVDTSNVLVEDPVLLLAKNQTGGAALDAGFIIERGTDTNVGFIWDESADRFAVINTTEIADDNDITIASYAAFKAGAGNFSGHVTLAGDGGSRLLFGSKIGLEGQITSSNLDLAESFANTRVRCSTAMYPTNSITLGTSAYRWTNVYSAAGNFTGQITQTGNGPNYGLEFIQSSYDDWKIYPEGDTLKITQDGSGGSEFTLTTDSTDHTNTTLSLGGYGVVTTKGGFTLGGTITTNSGGGAAVLGSHLDLGDNQKARFGAGDDLQIYHDGSTSFIKDVGTGNLEIWADGAVIIKSGDGTETKALFDTNGSVDLYYNNSKKLETTSTGIDITGNATFADNGKAIFGAGSDLEIYHNASDSVIRDVGTGRLLVGASEFLVTNSALSEAQIQSLEDGAVTLYHNGAAKLATASTGVDVTGILKASTTGTDVYPLRVSNTNTAAATQTSVGIEFQHNGGTGLARIRSKEVDVQDNFADLIFDVAGGTGGAPIEAMRILADGNVGIGTTAPGSYKLKVQGSAWASSLYVGGTVTLDGQLSAIQGSSYLAAVYSDSLQSQYGLIVGTTTTLGGALTGTTAAFSGEIAANGGIALGDSDKATFGAGDDLQIYHDGSNSYINEVGTGDLIIKGGNDIIFQDAVGNLLANMNQSNSVELYFGGSKKFETTTDGVSVTGKLYASGYIYANGGLALEDNDKILLGNQSDLQLYHSSSDNHSYIKESGTGHLYIQATNLRLQSATGENFLEGVQDGAVNLYYDDVKKLATTSTGVDVTGGAVLNGSGTGTGLKVVRDSSHEGSIYISSDGTSTIFSHTENSSDATAGHGGFEFSSNATATSSNELFKISNAGGEVLRINNDKSATFGGNVLVNSGSIILYGDGDALFAGVSANMSWDRSDSALEFQDNAKIKLGTGDDLQIYHDGSNSYIKDSGTGDLFIQGSTNVQIEDAAGANMIFATSGGSVKLFHNALPKIETTSTGIDVTGIITTDGLTTSADINFGDNDKAVFGASSDLQIYHDGSDSYIKDAGTGTLRILSDDVRIMNAAGTEISAQFIQDGEARLKYDNVTKLATKSSGVDVTGGLLSATSSHVQLNNGYSLRWESSGATKITGGAASAYLAFDVNSGERMRINSSGSVGIGTDTPGNKLDIWDATSAIQRFVRNDASISSNNSLGQVLFGGTEDGGTTVNLGAGIVGLSAGNWSATASGGKLLFKTTDSGTTTLDDRMVIDHNGYVGIGTTTPSVQLQTTGDVIVGGNLTVSGTTFTVDTSNVLVEDPVLLLAKNQTGGAALDAGFLIERGTDTNVGFIWDESADQFAVINTTEIADDNDITIASYADFKAGTLYVGASSATTVYSYMNSTTRNKLIVPTNATLELWDGTQKRIEILGGATNGVLISNKLGVGVTPGSYNLNVNGTANISGDVELGGHISLADSKTAYFGAGNDLKIYHNGTDSYIKSEGVGDLYIQQDVNDKDIKFQCDDGSGGLATYFALDGSDGYSKAHKKIRFLDQVQATFGNTDDLQIHHDGSHSYIDGTTTGSLKIRSINDDVVIQAADDVFIYTQAGENAIIARGNGKVELFYDGSSKLETTSTGIDITGHVSMTTGASAGKFAVMYASVHGSYDFYNNGTTYLNGATIIDADTTVNGSLDVSEGLIALKIGADSNATTRTNATNKYGRIGSQHYTNAEQPIGVGFVESNATQNNISFGGGSGYLNAATELRFFTAANNTTTTGTQQMTILSNGNVGIGTTAPGELLQVGDGSVNGTSIEINSASWAQLKLTSPNTNGAYIMFGDPEDEDIGNIFYYHGSNANYMSFTTNASEQMRIDKNGKVGIGCTDPAAPLEVRNASGGMIRMSSGDASNSEEQVIGGLEWYNHDASGDGPQVSSAIKALAQGSGARSDLVFYAKDAGGEGVYAGEAMRINGQSGYLGINVGTVEPSNQLTIESGTTGESISDGLRLQNSHGVNNDISPIYFGVHGGTRRAKCGIGWKRTGSYGIGKLLFALDNNGDDADVSFANDTKITFQGDGKVGIGTTNPGYLLDVNGTANIGGALTVSGLTSLATNGSGYALKISENSGGEYFQLGVNSYGGLEFYNETTKVAEFYDTGDFKIPDSLKILMGTGDDLQIYHTGSESWIADTGSGDLNLSTNGNRIKLWKGIGTEALANFEANGAVSLYYDNAVKLATTATGVDITGQLSATTKSFLIDHPTKPGKKLRHGSLEGPENGVYIRGKSDSNIIELPEYWTKLIDEDSITVQLTPIGKHQHIYVESIKNNVIHIQSDESRKSTNNLEYYYLILAERKDVDKLVIEE